MSEKMGIHIILDLFDCPVEKLQKVDFVREACLDTVNHAGLSVLKEHFHQFEPEGATGMLLLAESHLSIHTWPEHNSAAVDIFCCFLNGDEKAKEKAEKASEFLIEKFGAKNFIKNVHIR